ncbi:MAG: hypothetical protein ACOH2V_12180, partial [Candidatus Saccharimonadaceae bacterium]
MSHYVDADPSLDRPSIITLQPTSKLQNLSHLIAFNGTYFKNLLLPIHLTSFLAEFWTFGFIVLKKISLQIESVTTDCKKFLSKDFPLPPTVLISTANAIRCNGKSKL